MKMFKIPPIVWIVSAIVLVWQFPKLASSISFIPQDARFSEGKHLLITEKNNTNKLEGIKAYNAKDYKLAIEKLQLSLQEDRNDPEALMYLNNAIAMEHNPLKIAMVVPIGNNLNIAQEMLRGVAQAQDEINYNRGINGRYLHITIVNDSNDPEQSEEVAQKLSKDPEILAVIGSNASNSSLKAAPIYQQNKLVMITPTSFANGIPDVGDYIFRTVPNIQALAQSLGNYAQSYHKKLAICYDEQALDGVSFKDEFLANWVSKGGQLASTVCNFSQPAFNAEEEVNEAVSSGADGLLIVPNINNLDQAYQLAEANQGKLPLLGNSTLYTIKTLEAGKQMENVTLSIPWTPQKSPQFSTSARQLWGGDVTWRTASSYDAIRAIIEGLKNNQTREGLQQALSNSSFVANTPNGAVKFLPNGDRKGTGIIVQVKPSTTHQTGYEFVSKVIK